MNTRKLIRSAVRYVRYLATGRIVVALMEDGQRKVHLCVDSKEAMDWLACYSRRTSCYVYRMRARDMQYNLECARLAVA